MGRWRVGRSKEQTKVHNSRAITSWVHKVSASLGGAETLKFDSWQTFNIYRKQSKVFCGIVFNLSKLKSATNRAT